MYVNIFGQNCHNLFVFYSVIAFFMCIVLNLGRLWKALENFRKLLKAFENLLGNFRKTFRNFWKHFEFDLIMNARDTLCGFSAVINKKPTRGNGLFDQLFHMLKSVSFFSIRRIFCSTYSAALTYHKRRTYHARRRSLFAVNKGDCRVNKLPAVLLIIVIYACKSGH